MGSTSMTTTVVALLLSSPPSQKLTRGNFLFWKILLYPALCGAQVMDLLDGTYAAPAMTLEFEDENKKKMIVPNPAYTAWVVRDQAVVTFLMKSFSPEILAHVEGLETSAAI